MPLRNRTIYIGDNLERLRGIDGETVDLIYLDPPFNSKGEYQWPLGAEDAARSDDRRPGDADDLADEALEAMIAADDGAAFKDAFTLDDLDEATLKRLLEDGEAAGYVISAAGMAVGPGTQAYLTFMYERLVEMHRILKPTGSLWLHCDPTEGAWLKALMDAVFGRERFRNEVVWHYYNKFAAGARIFAKNFDTLFFYEKSPAATFNPLREEREEPVRQLIRESVGGVLRNKRDEEGNLMYQTVTDRKVDAVWRIPTVVPASSEWMDWDTQKPLALLERIVAACSNEGDLVLDPFCGCATACVAAERLHRQWIGMDRSPRAGILVRKRLREQDEGIAMWAQDVVVTRAIPERTDATEPAPTKAEIKQALFERQQIAGTDLAACAAAEIGCKHQLPIELLEIDRIRPGSKGGEYTLENTQLLCGRCNRTKGNRDMAYLARRLAALTRAVAG